MIFQGKNENFKLATHTPLGMEYQKRNENTFNHVAKLNVVYHIVTQPKADNCFLISLLFFFLLFTLQRKKVKTVPSK